MLECFPNKAFYRPGEPVTLRVKANGLPPAAAVLCATISEFHIPVATLRAPLGADTSAEMTWTPPASDYTAYGVDLVLQDGDGKTIAETSTAFDVAEHWSRAPRYGFMTEFSAGETLSETRRRLDLMLRFHINCLLFYDWMYTHHAYLPPTDNFVDSMGRELSILVVRRKVRFAQQLGMGALAYAPMYAAEEPFLREHPDWAMYRSDGEPFNVARLFYIMDVRPDSPWTEHILREYQRAIADVGFDGIHIDQFGFPKKALAYPGKLGQEPIDLSDQILPFVQRAQAAVSAVKPDARLIFHSLNNWPIRKVAPGPQAANYIQVFTPHRTYRDLRDLIAGSKALAPRTPVILGTYLRCFADGTDVDQAEASLRLLTAVIHACGGHHLMLGEGDGVLTEGYFPNYARLRPEAIERLRRYYDFIVRFGPLLDAPSEQDVSETHAGGITEEYAFIGAPTSSSGQPGTVWTIVREHPELTSLNLINLTGSKGFWDQPQPEPPAVTDLQVICRVLWQPSGVWLSSPDWTGGRLTALPFTLEHEPHMGHVLRFTVPRLQIWNLLLIT